MGRTTDIIKLFPKSDVELAAKIGISVKTVKRLRNGQYSPKSWKTMRLLHQYVEQLKKDIATYEAIHIDSLH